MFSQSIRSRIKNEKERAEFYCWRRWHDSLNKVVAFLFHFFRRCSVFWSTQMRQHCRMFCQCITLSTGLGNQTQMTRTSYHYWKKVFDKLSLNSESDI